MKPDRRLTGAAFLTWAVAALPVLAEIAAGEVAGVRAVVWTIAFVAFGAALTGYMLPRTCASSPRVVALLVVQSISALTMVYVEGPGTAGAMLAIVAAE